ncbi:MAG: AAA family ATPase [Clostridium sp.]|nr:AAA family ATPase [Clostridium sp.]
MTLSIAITGKSGSGKTTITKNFIKVLKQTYPEKSILLFDNDLSTELAHSYGMDVRNTIYGIRSGKHEYKTGIPSKMTKQEYIEWALEDIVVEVEENVDLIVSWLVPSKDCRCPITGQISYAVGKLISRYDIVVFDCEFDLKYLHQLVDIPMDVTLIIANATEESIFLAQRIEEFSAKYAAGGQMALILNNVENEQYNKIQDYLSKYSLEVLGIIPKDKELIEHSIDKNSKVIEDAIKSLYFRLNLPQVMN